MEAKIAVGGREVLHWAGLIVPPDEEARIEFSVEEWVIRLRIVFEIQKAEEGKPPPDSQLRLEPMDDFLRVTLVNWANVLGTVTTTPLELATTRNGDKLYFMLWHTAIAGAHRLDLQVMRGERP